MKKQIFLYLFVFSTLLALFLYVSLKRVSEEMNTKLDKQKVFTEKCKDSILFLENENLELAHFNFDKNEDAISYFERSGFDYKEIELLVEDELYELNLTKSEEHPVIPYASSEGRKMLINTVKLLNHKWIIADFSDGEYWGEILLRYYVNEDKTVDFELLESFLYPFD